jgi:hypothetical protein
MPTLQAIIIVGSALTSAYFGLKLCAGITSPREKLRVAALCGTFLASMFGIGGLISVRRITHSARPSIEGIITNLRKSGGKSPHSYFDLLTPDGRTVQLQMIYHGPEIQNGESAAATYLVEYSAVLELKIFHSQTSSWTIREGDGLKSSYYSIGAGGLLALLATAFWMKLRIH